MNRRTRLLLSSLLLPAVLVGVPAWLTWRAVRQERLDRALIIAVKQRNVTAVVSLLHQGANANARDTPPDNRSFRRRVIDLCLGRRFSTSKGPTALLVALDNPRREKEAYGDHVIDIIVTHVASPSGKAHTGNKPHDQGSPDLDSVLQKALGHRDIDPLLVKTLLEAGADPDIAGETFVVINNMTFVPPIELTPLAAAAYAAVPPDTLRLLLDKGAHINARSYGGLTALMGAAQSGNPDKVKLLLERGADVTLKDEEGDTALLLAEGYHRPDIIRLLKQAGAKE